MNTLPTTFRPGSRSPGAIQRAAPSNVDELVALGLEASRDHELGARPESHQVQDQLRHLFVGVVAAQLGPVFRCEGLGSRKEREREAEHDLLVRGQTAMGWVFEMFDHRLVEPAINRSVEAQIAAYRAARQPSTQYSQQFPGGQVDRSGISHLLETSLCGPELGNSFSQCDA